MATNVSRYRHGGRVRFGVVRGDGIVPIDGHYATTGDFLVNGAARAMALATAAPSVPLGEVELLSPITSNQQIVCQGLNYRSHRVEAGHDVGAPPFNMIFRKASSALAPATSPIVRPPHVRLLDYEIELGVVVGRRIERALRVTAETLADYVAALVITNDVSARDVQIPESQFYKGKSYRTFAPTGPWLCLLDRDDFARVPDLELTLTVNGEVRQHATVSQMLFGPAETLNELSALQDLEAGDLISTGTPGGVALSLPGPVAQRFASLLPEKLRWKLFLRSQAWNTRYLKPGDIVVSRIRTPDGNLDLGEQRNVVVDASR